MRSWIFAQLQNCPEGSGSGCDTTLPTVAAGSDTFQTILQLFFGVFGAVAVLIFVWAGFKFIISAGDPQAISKARNMMIYAAVGIAVVLTAEIIVTYVLGNL